jgi:hypothetical protein
MGSHSILKDQGRKNYQVIEYLVSYDMRHYKALLAFDAVDDRIAVDFDEMFAIQNGVLVLYRISIC